MAKAFGGKKTNFRWQLWLLLAIACTGFNHALAEGVASAPNMGKTTVAIWVDEGGKAKRVQIQRSCGQRNCDAAAMAVAMAWTFPPFKGDMAAQAPRLLTIGVDVAEELSSVAK
jgi:TonB family protein